MTHHSAKKVAGEANFDSSHLTELAGRVPSRYLGG